MILRFGIGNLVEWPNAGLERYPVAARGMRKRGPLAPISRMRNWNFFSESNEGASLATSPSYYTTGYCHAQWIEGLRVTQNLTSLHDSVLVFASKSAGVP